MIQRQRLKRLLRLGMVCWLALSSLPEQSPGQGAARSADRRCQNCHGQEHITTISLKERETMVVAPESGLEERADPSELFVDETGIAGSAHEQLSCVDCHPDADSLPHRSPLSKPQCRACHEEEAVAVSSSKHAEVLQRTEPPAPDCWDCHGAHSIRFQSEVDPLDKIRICASCHQTHSGQIEGVENGEMLVRSYMDSVHGRDTGEPGSPSVGATCEDCHGQHDILSIKDPRSRVHPRNVPKTCGNCHPDIYDEFEETIHADIANSSDPSARPAICTNCHTAHAITHAGTPSFTRDLTSECGSCHENMYRTYLETYHGQVLSLGGTRAARCSDCHGTHNIRRPADPMSTLSASNRPATCARCHERIGALSEAGRRNFIEYRPHADFRNGAENPLLFLIWNFSIGLGVALLLLWTLHWLGWVHRTFKEKPAPPETGGKSAILRFRPLHRWTHTAALCCVYGLIITGLPLKLGRQPAIAGLIRFLVEAEILGILHRLLAVLLCLIALLHILYLLTGRMRRNRTFAKQVYGGGSLLPAAADLRRFREMLRWFVKKGARPKLDSWSYSEKFDYWALAITLAVLAVSGMVLWFPVYFAEFISGYWFNAAMVVHSYAGLLVLGMILLVHILNSSLRRKGFPFNTAMFTGQICENDLRIERAAQYARLAETGALERLKEPAVSGRKLKRARFAAAAAQLLGIGLIILMVIAIIG